MLREVRVTPDFPDLSRLKTLYRDAFPVCERGPLMEATLCGQAETGELLAFYDGDEFCGFASLLTEQTLTHILYLAVCPELRERHYGTEIIACIRRRYPQSVVLADLEADEFGVDNRPQRQARIRFYQRNGFQKTEVAYRWQGEDYVIYALGGTVTEEAFDDFWRQLERQGITE